MGIDDPNPSAEELAAWKRHAALLESSDPDEYFRYLERLMTAESRDARFFAAQQASICLDVRALPAITRALHDHDFPVRQFCASNMEFRLERGHGDPAFRALLADALERSVRSAPHEVFGLELACLAHIDRDRAVRLCAEPMRIETAPPVAAGAFLRTLHDHGAIAPLATLQATLANAKADYARQGPTSSATAAWGQALLGLASTDAPEFEREVAEAESTRADTMFHENAARALLARHGLGAPWRPELYRSADQSPPGPAQLVGAILDLSGTIQSDGAWGYLAETKPRRRAFALQSLRTVNAPATADLIRRAAVLSGRSLNVLAILAFLRPRAAAEELREIDLKLWADDEAVSIKVARYILANRSHFPHLEIGGVRTPFRK